MKVEDILKTYKQAAEVLERNQKAVVLFTHGDYFSYDAAGSGETGKWHLNPSVVETVDKVIVYLRQIDKKGNTIFLGNYTGIQQSDLPKRYLIHFSALKEVGSTESNWLEFAHSGQNPVGYVTAR